MTLREKVALWKERLNRMENLKTEANIKSNGVKKHLIRRIRNAEAQL